MAAHKIQVGQLWRKVDNNELFLVTRIYDEALTRIAVLRRTGAETEGIIRIKIARNPAGQSLPGFAMDQEAEQMKEI